MDENRVGGVYRVEIIHTLERAAQPQTELAGELTSLIIDNMPDVVKVDVEVLWGEPIRTFEQERLQSLGRTEQ